MWSDTTFLQLCWFALEFAWADPLTLTFLKHPSLMHWMFVSFGLHDFSKRGFILTPVKDAVVTEALRLEETSQQSLEVAVIRGLAEA